MQLLIPLLIILLTYNAFAGERESGTLLQLLSTGTPMKQFAAGKILGVVSCLGMLLVPAAVLGVAGLFLAAEKSWWIWSGPRFLLMSAGYLAYFNAFIAIGLAVSALVKSTRTALITLLASWMLNCLLIPRAVSDFAERVYRAPTTEEFWAQYTRTSMKA